MDDWTPWDDEDDGLGDLRRLDDFIENGVGGFTLQSKLAEGGEAIPPLESLTVEELPRALTNLIWGLYDLGVIISDTDHLSDRELYAELVAYSEEMTITFPHDPYSNCRWSPIGGCSEEDMDLHYRFYADDQDREDWMRQFPDFEMPRKELAPYPRPWIPCAVPRTPRRESVEP